MRSSPEGADCIEVTKAAGFDLDYLESRDGRLLAAVRIGGVRLIDNVRE